MPLPWKSSSPKPSIFPPWAQVLVGRSPAVLAKIPIASPRCHVAVLAKPPQFAFMGTKPLFIGTSSLVHDFPVFFVGAPPCNFSLNFYISLLHGYKFSFISTSSIIHDFPAFFARDPPAVLVKILKTWAQVPFHRHKFTFMGTSCPFHDLTS